MSYLRLMVPPNEQKQKKQWQKNNKGNRTPVLSYGKWGILNSINIFA